MALVILFDQFSRNLYRNTAKMYATDLLALDLTQRSIADGMDKNLQLIERLFLYTPLMHAEELGVQQLSLIFFGELVKDCERSWPKNIDYFKYTFDYAQRHFEIIKCFERFPHRNKILNRQSTVEEVDFLKTPNSSF